MSVWDLYGTRTDAGGCGRRDRMMRREQELLRRKLPAHLSWHTARVDGQERALAILNSDNLDQKTVCSLPGEDIRQGSLVEWMGNRWLVTERDANIECYARAKMLQCNYLLRWVNGDDEIVERWCIVEDGTKYLTGEYGDKQFIITRGDSRISMTIARDAQTIRLNRNSRFLIDDYDSPNVLAYRLTKPFKLGGSFQGDGVLNFVLQECNTEDSDNLELHIANYYDHFPREEVGTAATQQEMEGEAFWDSPRVQTGPTEEGRRKVWL